MPATKTAAHVTLDMDLDAIAAKAARVLDRGEVVLDTDGDPAGVTYYDAGTRQYYAATIEECGDLLIRMQSGERDAYSLWCASSWAQPYATAEGAASSL